MHSEKNDSRKHAKIELATCSFATQIFKSSREVFRPEKESPSSISAAKFGQHFRQCDTRKAKKVEHGQRMLLPAEIGWKNDLASVSSWARA
jgi:hypothetical protein